MFVCITMHIEVHTKGFLENVCVSACNMYIVTVGLGDHVNWWWIVSVTGLETTAIVKQLRDIESVCARRV